MDQSSTPNLPEKHKLIQRQLLLLLHADNCFSPNVIENNHQHQNQKHNSGGVCTIQHCATMKKVLAHLANVSHSPAELTMAAPGNRKCTFPYCYSSSLILGHWKSCNISKPSQGRAPGPDAAVPTIHGTPTAHCLICEPAKQYYGAQQQHHEYQQVQKQSLRLKRTLSTLAAAASSIEFQNIATAKRLKQASILPEFTAKIWSGTLIWHKQPTKSSNNNSMSDLLNCQIFSSSNQRQLKFDSGSNLNMKLIPTSLFNKLGLNMDQDTQPLSFTFNYNYKNKETAAALEELKYLLGSNHYLGLIYTNNSNSSESNASANVIIKILVLQQHDGEGLNKFIGWAPIHQDKFIEKLKGIVWAAKMRKSFHLEVVKRLNQIPKVDKEQEKKNSTGTGAGGDEMILS